MDKWEKEAGITITEEEWKCICTSQWRSTNSHTWKEFCWKSVTRFFITPQQSAHFSQGNSCCWRNCGCQIAHHFHVFWDCHILQKYWYDVNNAIKHIFHTNIPLDFKTMFLGYKTQAMQTLDGYLWNLFLAAAKKAITKKCGVQKEPNVQDWAHIVMGIYKMEKITFFLKRSFC